MLVLKSREKSSQLKGYESLNSRLSLSKDELSKYNHLKTGLEGEITFDKLVQTRLNKDILILNDLLLSVNGSSIQIDSLILMNNSVYIFEIKNYKGEYRYESGKYISKRGYTIVSPNNQLERTATLFAQLMKSWNYSVNVVKYLVFINPEFTLYRVESDDSVCLPTQINELLRKLGDQEVSRNPKLRQLANRLLENHKQNVPFELNLPTYAWEDLLKGPTCTHCRSFTLTYSQRSCVCKACGMKTDRLNNIIGNVEEMKLLFPEMKITTKSVSQWLNGALPAKSIRRALNTHYKKQGKSQGVYYL